MIHECSTLYSWYLLTHNTCEQIIPCLSTMAADALAPDVTRSSSAMILTRLTHWGRVTHIPVDKLAIIGSDNGLLPGQHQAIIWSNVGILLIGPLGTNFSEFNFNNDSNILIQENAFESAICKIMVILSWPQCVKWNCSCLSWEWISTTCDVKHRGIV